MTKETATTGKKTLICVIRAGKGVWDALKQLEHDSNGQVIVWQGQAKTYSNGAINAKLFADQDWDDHPGPAPSTAEKETIKSALSDPNHDRIVVNSFAGENAPDRCQAGEYLLAHLARTYPNKGKTGYTLLYDGNARDDKVHMVDSTDAAGQTVKVSEDNAPGGIYAPFIYKAVGATDITLIDPHSKKHVSNYIDVFGKNNVAVLSSLDLIADNIVSRHADAIRGGTFRIGAPDGWDKRNAPGGNAALDRIKDVTKLVWEKLPGLENTYGDYETFHDHCQFGITKTREVQYPGQPTKPKTLSMHGDVEGCVCVLVDDEVDSGSSITGGATFLLESGAERVEACICHGPTYLASLNRVLDHSYEDASGKNTASVNHFTITNSMARVQGAHGDGFYGQLDDQKRKRTTLLNCGDVYAAQLRHDLGLPPAVTAAPAASTPKLDR